DDRAAVLHVRVVAEVGALVDEALAAQVDDEPERVGVLLEIVADLAVAVPGRVEVPLHGVAAAPMSPGQRTHLEGHANAVAGVVRRAADPRQLPVGAKIARAHLGVGLEATRRQHDRAGRDRLGAPGGASQEPGDAPAVVGEQARSLRLEPHIDSGPGGRGVLHVDEARSTADRFQDQSTPEAEFPADLVGLAAQNRNPSDPPVVYPAHGGLRLANDEQGQIRVGPVLGHAHQVVVEVVLSVRIYLHLAGLLIGEVADEAAQLVEALEGEPETPGGEEAVATAPRLRGLLDHEHARTRLAGGEGRAHRRVAAAHHYHVVSRCHEDRPPEDVRWAYVRAAVSGWQAALSTPARAPGAPRRLVSPGLPQ